MKLNVLFLSLILLCSFALPIVTSRVTWGAEVPIIYMEMFETLNNTLRPGSIFYGGLQLCNIASSLGVVGIEFGIWWDNSVVKAINMTEVVFHSITPESEVSNIWNVKEEVEEGWLYYNYTFQNVTRAFNGGYAPISGNHTIAIVGFEAVNPDDVHFTISISNLYDQNGQPVPHQTLSYDLRISAWEYLRIPYITVNEEWSIDGCMNEDAWQYAFHFHGSADNMGINLPYGRHIEYDFYLLGSNKSLYVAVAVPNNDFWTNGYEADILEVEINSRNDGCFSAEVDNPDGYSGNDLKELRATVSGRYTDYYFAGYVQTIDYRQDGNASYTFSGPRENGATGNYCYEMEIPFNRSYPNDAVFVDGKPFAMMLRYTDYVPPPEGQTWVQGWMLALISRSFLLAMTADLNGDFSVDIFDAIQLGMMFGKNAGELGYSEVADLNGDNTIDIFDAMILANNFGMKRP